MKKILSIVLAVLMLASCATMAFGATINQNSDPKNTDVVVETTLDGSTMPETGTYEVTIPANINIVWGTTEATPVDPAEAGSLNYEVTSQLALGAKLTVSVAADAADVDTDGNAALVCTTDATKFLAYEATGFGVQEFGEINDGKTPTTAVTIAVPDWSEAPVAIYDTKLTYTVAYVPAA